jgi:hypothetical protein
LLQTLIDNLTDLAIDRSARNDERLFRANQFQSLCVGIELPSDRNSIFRGLALIAIDSDADGEGFLLQAIESGKDWLPPRDSNPDSLLQRQVS